MVLKSVNCDGFNIFTNAVKEDVGGGLLLADDPALWPLKVSCLGAFLRLS